MVEPVNVVAGGSLNREVDIQTLSSELSKKKNVKTDFTDENRWQLVIEFNEGGKVLLYRTGSYIIRGGSSLDTLEKTKNLWFSLIKEENIVDDTSTVDYALQNIVFSGDLKQEVDLAVLSIQLGINKTEYEPEQFPGLIYRPEGFSVVILIFASGKVIITGGTKQKEAEAVMRHIQEQLDKE
jgi:transcription initiation factor TFIID TATA-box-binding protein